MEYKIESSGDSETVTISGELIISYASMLRNILIQLIERSDDIHIKLENVTEADLSCLQLFCSAHRTAVSLYKRLTLNSDSSQVFNKTVKDAGYSCHKECELNIDNSCLWIKGDAYE